MTSLHKVKIMTKPFWVPAIAGIYLLRTDSPDPLVIAALLFGYIGDLLLLRKKKSWFVTGAVSFLIGHLFYIAVFISDAGGFSVFRTHPAAAALMFLPYAVWAVMFRKYLGKDASSIYYASTIYISVLFLMSYFSLLRVWTVGTASFVLVFLGSLLFIASDSFLAIRKFKSEFRGIGTLVIATYIAAQLLIIFGISCS